MTFDSNTDTWHCTRTWHVAFYIYFFKKKKT